MEDEFRGLTQLIGEIYDAALDSARWTDVLAKIAGFVGGQAGALLTKDSVSKAGNVFHQWGVAPHYVRLYTDLLWCDDPVASLPQRELEQVVSIADLMPYDEFKSGRFYREWMEPQGWVDAAHAVLDKSITSCAYLGILRHQTSGMVDQEMRRRMSLIVPHVARAVVTSKLIDLKQAETATFAGILDGINAAIFLVAADGQIVHGNAASRSLLERGDFLRTIRGRLSATDDQIAQRLREIFLAAGNSEPDAGFKDVALPFAGQNGERYVGHVLALPPGERRPRCASPAVAALFVRKAELELAPLADVISKTYKLTPTELRVLLAIVNIGGVPQVASKFGVADTTVKTHLGRLFEKTGASRQADLVKVVAAFSSLLVH